MATASPGTGFPADGAAWPGSQPSSLALAEDVGQLPALVRAVTSGLGRQPCPLLVVGGGFRQRPWRDRVLDSLRGLRFELAVHAGTPTPDTVTKLALTVRTHRSDVVIAVGGGSVMDAAKCAAALAGHSELGASLVRRLCADGAPGQSVPVIAVPTTPGTGAEATPFATVWDCDRGRKLSLRGAAVRSSAAVVLDPDLLLGLPSAQLAISILDTLAQAMEASWSTKADATAEAFGTAALGQLADLLDRAPEAPDRADRRALIMAGHYSGQAIARAGTTLCHALSYPLTLRYGFPHGHACGLTLGQVSTFNAAVGSSDCRDQRGPERVRAAISASIAAIGASSVSEVTGLVKAIMVRGGLVPGIDLAPAARALAAEALSYDRAGNNPRRVDRDELALLLATTC